VSELDELAALLTSDAIWTRTPAPNPDVIGIGPQRLGS